MSWDRSGESNPNWRGGKIDLSCLSCGKGFSVIPSRKDKARFCTLPCFNKWQADHPFIPPNKGNRWGKGERMIDRACRECGRPFMMRISVRNIRHFCGPDCRITHQKREYSGVNHPCYKHGGWRVCKQCQVSFRKKNRGGFCTQKCRAAYWGEVRRNEVYIRKSAEAKRIRASARYREWRTSVYKRDNFTCQKCGRRSSGELTAHHIKPFSTHPELRFSVENGITLCWSPCHSSINGRESEFEAELISKIAA